MAKREVTQEDLDNDQALVDAGVKVGDEHDFPETGEEGADNGELKD